jgi:hypothetical protein
VLFSLAYAILTFNIQIYAQNMNIDSLKLPIEDILSRVKGTTAVDETGRPLILHHGTFATFERFSITEDIGFHFGTYETAQKRIKHAPLRPAKSKYKPDWHLVSACLNIQKPVFLEMDPRSWSSNMMLEAIKGAVPADALARVIATKADRNAIKDALMESGYDGICYVNFFEKKNVLSWVAFDDAAIIQIGRDLKESVLPATDEQMKATGYWAGSHIAYETIPGSRTKNHFNANKADEISLVSKIMKEAKNRPAIGVCDKITSCHGFDRKVRLVVNGEEYVIDVDGIYEWKIPIRKLSIQEDRLSKLPERVVEWPLKATSSDTAKLVLDYLESMLAAQRDDMESFHQIRSCLIGQKSCVTDKQARPLIMYASELRYNAMASPLFIPFGTRDETIKSMASYEYTAMRQEIHELDRKDKSGTKNELALGCELLKAAVLLSSNPLVVQASFLDRGYSSLSIASSEEVWRLIDSVSKHLAKDFKRKFENQDAYSKAYLEGVLETISVDLMKQGWDAICLTGSTPGSQVWRMLSNDSIIELPDHMSEGAVADNVIPETFRGTKNPAGKISSSLLEPLMVQDHASLETPRKVALAMRG